MLRILNRCRTVVAAFCLGLLLMLTACSNASSALSGMYVDDTVAVADRLLEVIAIPQEDPARKEAEQEARALINDYMSRYRPQPAVNGLASFTTMQTALNSLAGHYASYANRPLPESLRSRLERELRKAETSVVRGT